MYSGVSTLVLLISKAEIRFVTLEWLRVCLSHSVVWARI